MPPDLEPHLPELTRKDLLYPLFCRRPKVRILLYTDSTSVQMNKSAQFGLQLMRDWIVDGNPFYASFEFDLVNRHTGGHAAKKLTATLLANYDQVWFFGVLQCNLPTAQQNELTTSEVSALRAWMDAGGGVLITGDHANPKPIGAAAGLDPLLNLGRAIGRAVPRAGQLRKWEGLPDSSTTDNHNTMVPTLAFPDLNLGGQPQQQDNVPQRLILTRHTIPSWIPYFVRRRRPHPLFCGKDGLIDVFPDHMHEGLPVLPTTYGSEWPSTAGGYQPIPTIEAKGTDKRNGKIYPVTIAYDGDDVSVGRIVADATWHHYFNINLWGWTSGSPAYSADGSAAQKAIANYYQNLAVWLSPRAKRQVMRCRTYWWLLNHPEVAELTLGPLHVLGGTALDVLGRSASQCLIYELVFIDLDRFRVYERFPKVPPIPWPPIELVLGGTMLEYQEAAQRALAKKTIPAREDLQQAGFRRAFAFHTSALAADLKEAKHGAEAFEASLHVPRRRKRKG
ncbi:MAG: hypothetical protein R3F56_20765 [Planctomycetota bacterium]